MSPFAIDRCFNRNIMVHWIGNVHCDVSASSIYTSVPYRLLQHPFTMAKVSNQHLISHVHIFVIKNIFVSVAMTFLITDIQWQQPQNNAAILFNRFMRAHLALIYDIWYFCILLLLLMLIAYHRSSCFFFHYLDSLSGICINNRINSNINGKKRVLSLMKENSALSSHPPRMSAQTPINRYHISTHYTALLQSALVFLFRADLSNKWIRNQITI